MKKILDKLSITSLCIVILLSFSITPIKYEPSPIKDTTIIKQVDTSTTKTIAMQPPIEEPKTEPRTYKKKALSRGGSIPTNPKPNSKPKNQHDIINDYARDIGLKYNIEPELIMSMIYQESRYDPKAKNGNCLGLMQVSSYWHKNRASKLGVSDFYDPYSNILLGVDYISELYTKYKDIRLVLMMYNMDNNTALRLYKNGQISDYAKTVISRAEKYKKGE